MHRQEYISVYLTLNVAILKEEGEGEKEEVI